jgi:hypothetical protein
MDTKDGRMPLTRATIVASLLVTPSLMPHHALLSLGGGSGTVCADEGSCEPKLTWDCTTPTGNIPDKCKAGSDPNCKPPL